MFRYEQIGRLINQIIMGTLADNQAQVVYNTKKLEKIEIPLGGTVHICGKSTAVFVITLEKNPCIISADFGCCGYSLTCKPEYKNTLNDFLLETA
ncbi:MAG: hypothetical protein GY799_21050 [Desulfobulbaceae bacterium]|nr:hypothetical protein [Desulfobulbaceae bacterium]